VTGFATKTKIYNIE
jgi:hypothetical protein